MLITLNLRTDLSGWLKSFVTSALPRILGTALIVVAGWFVTRLITNVLKEAMSRSKAGLDVSLINFIVRTVDIVLKVLVILTALTNLGISTTGIIAAFSACAVAISLALKDSLGNIAGGIMMLISRPFSTGDFIETDGFSGKVQQIDLVHTTLLTSDNRRIVIPNGKLMNMTVTDYSREATRRMDLSFGIGYDADPEKAKRIIADTVAAHEAALKEPKPFIRVTEHAESAVIITLRVWCKTADYWTLHFDLLERVRSELEKNGITFPYNQLDVHITEHKTLEQLRKADI